MQFPFTYTGSLCFDDSDFVDIISKINNGWSTEKAIKDTLIARYGYYDDTEFAYLIVDDVEKYIKENHDRFCGKTFKWLDDGIEKRGNCVYHKDGYTYHCCSHKPYNSYILIEIANGNTYIKTILKLDIEYTDTNYEKLNIIVSKYNLNIETSETYNSNITVLNNINTDDMIINHSVLKDYIDILSDFINE